VIVLATIALAAIWPLAWAREGGDVTALLGIGSSGPARALLEREVGHGTEFLSKGHDGQQFYAVARHPLDPSAASSYLDEPAYRYRRILFPALAWVVAPHGGRVMAFAFAGISLLGVGLGAWALQRRPGTAPWVPLLLAVNPGIIAALWLSLADALATGLVLAAFAAAYTRRLLPTVVLLVLAALPRETSLHAAVALACAPGLSTRARAVTVLAPSAVLCAWMLYVGHALDTSLTGGSSQQLSFPLVGWTQSNDDARGLLLALLLAVVIALGAARAERDVPVRVYLGLSLLLFSMLSSDVTGLWIDASRVVAAALPLAIAVIFQEPAHAT
jgi:hypothetical protein